MCILDSCVQLLRIRHVLDTMTADDEKPWSLNYDPC